MTESPEVMCESHDPRPCRVGVLYGGRWADGAIGPVYDSLIEVFREQALPIDRIQLRAPGFGKTPLPFRRTDTRLRRGGIEALDHAELFVTQPGGTHPIFEWLAEGSLAKRDGLVHFGVIEESITYQDLHSSQAWMKLVARCQPAYAILFRAPRRIGPGYDARGMNFGNADNVVASGHLYDSELRVTR